jgi:thiamine monophosphate synthase
MLQVRADEVGLAGGSKDVELLNRIVAAGATAVVLEDSAEAGANVLYEAAVRLKEVLRGRAALLLVDRTDITLAAEADGVLLSDKGEA